MASNSCEEISDVIDEKNEEIKIPQFKINAIEETAGVSYSLHVDPEHPTMSVQSASKKKSISSVFTDAEIVSKVGLEIIPTMWGRTP